jgi:hypothetical protein
MSERTMQDIAVAGKQPFYEFIERIEQIDRLLEEPVRSLIEYARREPPTTLSAEWLQDLVQLPLYFPPWVAADRLYPLKSGGELPRQSITTAVCCATLQRLWYRRRRIPWLEKVFEKLPEKRGRLVATGDPPPAISDLLARAFLPPTTTVGGGNRQDLYRKYLRTSGLLGESRSLMAAETMWALIHAEEGVAYTGAGLLAFFGILWSLFERAGGPPAPEGAAFGLAPPTAYVTARCLFPLHELETACRKRADLIDRIAKITESLEGQADGREVPFLLDRLATALADYAEVSIARKSFQDCMKTVEEKAGQMTAGSDVGSVVSAVRQALAKALAALGDEASSIVEEAQPVTGRTPDGRSVPGLLDEICDALASRAGEERLRALGVVVPRPELAPEVDENTFWKAQKRAADRARKVCLEGFAALEMLSAGRRPKPGGASGELNLAELAAANRKVAKVVADAIGPSVQWCEGVMLREIAQASAANFTELSPAELVSGLAVAVMAGRLPSSRRVTDAVEKALCGARADGSFAASLPYAVDQRTGYGESAPTAAIVWMLSGAIARDRSVSVADRTLERYVDWLEDTRGTVDLPGEPPLRFTGWRSDRAAHLDRIDLWATAFAINSLINIRGLMEYRLWQVCEERFTVLDGTDLADIEPGDLGACHSERLHRKFAQMARRAESADYSEADYSVVLHGPPGSSKTLIARAIANEMWRGFRRRRVAPGQLVRITPADFTRGGEERLDAEARTIFDLLRHVRGVTILFDEIDDFLRRRQEADAPTFISLVVPGMLNRLQDLRDACPRQEVFFLLATNYVDRIEPALLRRGRIDRAMPLVYPDWQSRVAIVERRAAKLRKKLGGDGRGEDAAKLLRGFFDEERIAAMSYWPWMAIDALCREMGKPLLRGTSRSFEEINESWSELFQLSKSAVDAPLSYKHLRHRPDCRPLEDELLHYRVAGARTVEEYKKILGDWLQEEEPSPPELVDHGLSLWHLQKRP